MINPFSKIDVKKYQGKTIAVDANTGDVIATAKEKRSLKYDKSRNVCIVTLPLIQEQPEKQILINRIAIVLDESGSMFSLKESVVKVFNSLLSSLKEESLKNNQKTYLTLFGFSSIVREVYFNNEISKVEELKGSNYRTSGQTALFDAIGTAISRLKTFSPELSNKYRDANVSNLIYVLTDGYENNSYDFNSLDIQKLIKECDKEQNWTIALQLPPGEKNKFCDLYKISNDNVMEWQGTKEGIMNAGIHTQSAFTNYFAARSTGLKSVQNFYMDADLSNISSKDLKGLQDLSKFVKIYEVPKETVIKDFVEEKTKKPYIIGSAYYELSKKETIQPQKSVMIQDKTTKRVYGGDEARKLVRLPLNANTRVDVGNLANYRLFVNSTSVNRKLVRGSHILVDMNKTTNSSPTW